MNRSFLRLSILSLFLSVLLMSCSGGETGTGFTGSDPKVSVGVITGFGSVFVNGVEFETTDAEINVNESIAAEQDLSIGMVVAVVGSTSQGDAVGKADAIYYESEVCGIVSQNNQDGTLNVMGQIVKYDTETEFESTDSTIAAIEAIPEGAVVEVSGYRIGDNTLHATRLTLMSKTYTVGEEITVKGVVTAGLSNGKFSIGSLTMVVDSATQFIDIPNQQITPGMRVKVKSIRGVLNNELQTDIIDAGNKKYVSVGATLQIEGIVMNLVEPNEFLLNGYTVYFSEQTKFKGGSVNQLADGLKAEVEGTLISQNQIEAKQISFRKTARLQLIASVDSINPVDNQVNVAGVTVQLTNKTLLKDDDKATKIKKFSLADLSEGDKVKVKAYQDNLSGEIIATQFRRVEALSTDANFELSGMLDELNDTQAIIAGVGVDRTQIISPALTDQDVGTEVTVTGTAPLTNQ